MRTILLFLISVAVVLPATESNPRVTRVIDSFSEASQSAQEAYEEAIRAAEEARAQALNRARERAVRDLKRLVNRRGDVAEQATIYTQVLRLDREDEDAVAFFTAIGTLDNVLESLEPLVETDLLGNVVHPDLIEIRVPSDSYSNRYVFQGPIEVQPDPSSRWNSSPHRWSDVDFNGHRDVSERARNGMYYSQLCYRLGDGPLIAVEGPTVIRGSGTITFGPSNMEGGGTLRNNTGSIVLRVRGNIRLDE